jgi:hypothetical protein
MALDQTIIGMRFGRLVVTEVLGQRNGKTFVKVVCDCGNSKEMFRGNLNVADRGSKSCGCLRKENISKIKRMWQFPSK